MWVLLHPWGVPFFDPVFLWLARCLLLASKNHFTKSNLENTIGPLSGVLIEKLSSTNARNRYYAQLLQQGDQPIEGKIVVQFMSKNPIENLRIGRAFATNKIPSPIDPPKHPGQFDYKNYLANQRIFGELKLFEGDYTIVETAPLFHSK